TIVDADLPVTDRSRACTSSYAQTSSRCAARNVLAALARRGLRVIDQKTSLYFHDVADHLQRVVETVDVYHRTLASVLDSYNTQNSNALNQLMRLLTSVSIILMSSS